MKHTKFFFMLICLAFSCHITFSQSGPTIKVVASHDSITGKWTQYIVVKDDDGIKSVKYKEEYTNKWISLNIPGHCPKINAWPVTTQNKRIKFVEAKDCDWSYTTIDSDFVYKFSQTSLWFYYRLDVPAGDEPYPIFVKWMGDTEKPSPKITSVNVMAGKITDQFGGTLEPKDFEKAGGENGGFVARVKGSGRLEITMDPEGDLNIFEFDLIPEAVKSQPDILKYMLGAVGGIILLLLLWLIFRKRNK